MEEGNDGRRVAIACQGGGSHTAFTVGGLKGLLAGDVRVDLTKKQIARNGVAWMVRAPRQDDSSERSEGVAEAEFRGRETESLRLGART